MPRGYPIIPHLNRFQVRNVGKKETGNEMLTSVYARSMTYWKISYWNTVHYISQRRMFQAKQKDHME
jgi:hypothetical protein